MSTAHAVLSPPKRTVITRFPRSHGLTPLPVRTCCAARARQARPIRAHTRHGARVDTCLLERASSNAAQHGSPGRTFSNCTAFTSVSLSFCKKNCFDADLIDAVAPALTPVRVLPRS